MYTAVEENYPKGPFEGPLGSINGLSKGPNTWVLGQNSHKTSHFSSNVRTFLPENGEVGVEIHLRFPPRLHEP